MYIQKHTKKEGLFEYFCELKSDISVSVSPLEILKKTIFCPTEKLIAIQINY